jgi:hypothetical protein
MQFTLHFEKNADYLLPQKQEAYFPPLPPSAFFPAISRRRRNNLTQQLSELRLIILQSFFKSNLAPSLLPVDLLVLTAMVAGVPVQEINTA